MVSQVHTITNNILVTIGSVRGIPGYNPLLTMSHFYSMLLFHVMIVKHFREVRLKLKSEK